MNINITPEDHEALENLVFYYRRIGVEQMYLQHPYFLIDDMEKLLNYIGDMLEV